MPIWPLLPIKSLCKWRWRESNPRPKNTIKKLLKREWIKEIEPKIVSGGSVKQFIIVDIWKLNVDEYGDELKKSISELFN